MVAHHRRVCAVTRLCFVAAGRSLSQIGKDAALKHLLRDVRLGWEFTPAQMRVPSGGVLGAGQAGFSNGGVLERGEGGRKKKPTLVLLHGFMGSKVARPRQRGVFCFCTSDDFDGVMLDGWVTCGAVLFAICVDGVEL